MTREEAKANQDRIAKNYKLSYWYGTDCEKCCGVYPKFCKGYINGHDMCYYECEVCGKRTNLCEMPWIARDEWNAGMFREQQMCLF